MGIRKLRALDIQPVIGSTLIGVETFPATHYNLVGLYGGSPLQMLSLNDSSKKTVEMHKSNFLNIQEMSKVDA